MEAVGSMSGRDKAKHPGAKQGVNDFGKGRLWRSVSTAQARRASLSFRLYALDAELNLTPRVTRKQLEAAMKGHITAEADLVGTFERE